MTKRIIITCLRGTIGRWPKGKAIVIPVLVLILPLSPWRGEVVFFIVYAMFGCIYSYK